ncbi:MAG: PAS domain S-box protein [Spirochaetia bacterium]|jgi:PAS domain S-box-containing protein
MNRGVESREEILSRYCELLKTFESKSRLLQTLLDNLPDIIFQKDLSGRFVLVNRPYAEVVGLECSEMIGKNDADVFPEEIASRFMSDDRLVIETAQPLNNIEEPIQSARGQMRWLLTSKVPLFDESGHVLGLVGVGRDITERKDFEKKNRQLAMLVDATDNAILSFDLNYKLMSMNKAAENLYGYTADEVLGTSVFEAIPAEQESEIRCMLQRTAFGDPPGQFETTALRSDGSRIYVTVTLSAIRDEHEQVIGYVTVSQDITSQKQAQQALKDKERRQAEIIDFLPDATFAIDKEGCVIIWNRAIERLTGVPATEMIGKSGHACAVPIYGELRPLLLDLILETITEDHGKGLEESYDYVEISGDTLIAEAFVPKLHKGKGAYLWGVTTALRNESGSIVGAIESIRDITDRKLAEEERAKLERKILQAQKMDCIGRLAGGVAHDFNNMLFVILGRAEMALQQLAKGHALRSYLEEIHRAAERSAAMTRHLLTFARQQTVTPQILSLNPVVEEMLTILRRLIGENIDLVWRPGKNLWYVKMDPSQIDQLLTNLCVNARDAITNVGKITIETANCFIDKKFCALPPGLLEGQYVTLCVADNGCGMEKETLEHIYEPFFTTKEIGRGTGMGLATVYGIVKQNGGLIDAWSKPGLGTRFTIYLPKEAGELPQEDGQAAQGLAPTGTETILVVEDEAASRRLIEAILKKQGYNVIAAEGPRDALRIAKEAIHEINLLVTDVVMPEMNGDDLAMRLESLNPRLKCLFVSGYPADTFNHAKMTRERVHFVAKPFSIKDFGMKIREVLDCG